jgi:Zn-dependent protease with chaperone function
VIFADIAAVIAVISTGVIYGTDMFCALVLRPALKRIDDDALTSVVGSIHRFGDRRLPIPGILGVLFAALACVVAVLSGNALSALLSGSALVLLVVWLVVYLRISAPINRAFTTASERGEPLRDARSLQYQWERIIVARAVLQGLAILALCCGLLV